MKVAVFDVEPSAIKFLEEHFQNRTDYEVHAFAKTIDEVDLEQFSDSEAISVFITSKITAELIEKLPNLRLIACRSTGFDNVDTIAAKAKGITICNVPSYGENTVAEYAFTILLALARKLPASIEQIKDGAINHNQLVGFDLCKKTLGVVGTGKIGKHAISIGRGFGMHVIGYDPYPDEKLNSLEDFRYASFEELLKNSDVITIHVPLTKETEHMFNTEAFNNCLKKPAIINTSRGEIIDTKALVEALCDDKLAGAGLDVIEEENLLETDDEISLLAEHAPIKSLSMIAEQKVLEKMDNVILTPHNAFNTVEAVQRIWQTTLDNIESFGQGSPQNVIKS